MKRDKTKPAVGDDLPGHVLADGPSVVPRFRHIRKNMIIGVYQSQEDIDTGTDLAYVGPSDNRLVGCTDDGSSYYQTHDNYFAMAGRGYVPTRCSFCTS